MIEAISVEDRKAKCDLIVEQAATIMQDMVGAPVEMIIDRLLTYAAAQACVGQGSRQTARHFRELAQRIERGVFHSLTGEGQRH